MAGKVYAPKMPGQKKRIKKDLLAAAAEEASKPTPPSATAPTAIERASSLQTLSFVGSPRGGPSCLPTAATELALPAPALPQVSMMPSSTTQEVDKASQTSTISTPTSEDKEIASSTRQDSANSWEAGPKGPLFASSHPPLASPPNLSPQSVVLSPSTSVATCLKEDTREISPVTTSTSIASPIPAPVEPKNDGDVENGLGGRPFSPTPAPWILRALAIARLERQKSSSWPPAAKVFERLTSDPDGSSEEDPAFASLPDFVEAVKSLELSRLVRRGACSQPDYFSRLTRVSFHSQTRRLSFTMI